jgi:hypothetical protein
MFTRRMENVAFLVKIAVNTSKTNKKLEFLICFFESRLRSRPVAYAVGQSLTQSASRLRSRPIPLRRLSCRIVVKCLTALTDVLSPAGRQF